MTLVNATIGLGVAGLTAAFGAPNPVLWGSIAAVLGLSVKTAETHRTQLMQRLEIHDVAGLVRYAMRVGLINSDR